LYYCYHYYYDQSNKKSQTLGGCAEGWSAGAPRGGEIETGKTSVQNRRLARGHRMLYNLEDWYQEETMDMSDSDTRRPTDTLCNNRVDVGALLFWSDTKRLTNAECDGYVDVGVWLWRRESRAGFFTRPILARGVKPLIAPFLRSFFCWPLWSALECSLRVASATIRPSLSETIRQTTTAQHARQRKGVDVDSQAALPTTGQYMKLRKEFYVEGNLDMLQETTLGLGHRLRGGGGRPVRMKYRCCGCGQDVQHLGVMRSHVASCDKVDRPQDWRRRLMSMRLPRPDTPDERPSRPKAKGNSPSRRRARRGKYGVKLRKWRSGLTRDQLAVRRRRAREAAFNRRVRTDDLTEWCVRRLVGRSDRYDVERVSTARRRWIEEHPTSGQAGSKRARRRRRWRRARAVVADADRGPDGPAAAVAVVDLTATAGKGGGASSNLPTTEVENADGGEPGFAGLVNQTGDENSEPAVEPPPSTARKHTGVVDTTLRMGGGLDGGLWPTDDAMEGRIVWDPGPMPPPPPTRLQHRHTRRV
jgi:hypothetical protein